MEDLCKIRNLYRAIVSFETDFQAEFSISLNEGMALCTLKSSECLSSGELAECLGLSFSNTSKVIKTLEKKDLLKRCIGKKDKRQMLFSVSLKGLALLAEIKKTQLELPPLLAKSIDVQTPELV